MCIGVRFLTPPTPSLSHANVAVEGPVTNNSTSIPPTMTVLRVCRLAASSRVPIRLLPAIHRIHSLRCAEWVLAHLHRRYFRRLNLIRADFVEWTVVCPLYRALALRPVLHVCTFDFHTERLVFVIDYKHFFLCIPSNARERYTEWLQKRSSRIAKGTCERLR
jgi:hypothetical protein